MKVAITEDYPISPIIEKKILKKYLIKSSKKNEIEILLTWRKIVDQQYLENYPLLKHVIRYGSGYDNIDTEYLKRRKINLYNNPFYAYKDVSETAISLMFYFVTRIGEYNKIAKKSKNFDTSFLGIQNQRSFHALNVGIIGCGKIGSELSKKVSHFASNVYIFDKKKIIYNQSKYKNIYQVSLNRLLAKSDIISIHLELNKSTKGIINKNVIDKMGYNKIFINVSREELVENYDILDYAIEKNIISYAGLDISMVRKETIKSKLIKKWKTKKNNFDKKIIINPHVAFYSRDSFEVMRTRAAMTALHIIQKKQLNKYKVKL